MNEVAAYGSVGGTITVLHGTLQREHSFTIAIKLQPPTKDANYTIEMETDSLDYSGRPTYSRIEEEVDLTESSKGFRICILENVGYDGSPIIDKCQFYSQWNIMKRIDPYIPVKIEVTKLVDNEPEDYIPGEVSAIVELLDPPENIDIIRGPKGRGKNGSDFVKNLVYRENGGDNCPNTFAPIEFCERCRSPQDNVDKVQKIILDERRQEFKVHEGKPNAVVVPIRSLEEKVDKNLGKTRKIGYSKILLHFPPIAGNNYILIIKLINSKGQEISIKDKNQSDHYLFYIQTPKITIWKRIKMEMVALQEGIKYEDIGWNIVKSAFADAFIELEEPPPEKRYTITLKEWMEYLGNVVYSGWQNSAWKTYIQADADIHKQDFSKYSFPQCHDDKTKPDYVKDSQLLTPPDEDQKNPNRTTWTFLEKIAEKIFLDKLGNQLYNLLEKPDLGYNIGFCTLICKPPFKNSTVGGCYLFDKKFFVVSRENMESTFVHELGHALFLNHGATYFVRNADIPLITRWEKSGSEGPYWDEHDSEDMMTCIMSYKRHRVDWHFCGLCILKLRLYDINRMIKGEDDTLRKILYNRTPKVYLVKKRVKKKVTPDGKTVNKIWYGLHKEPPKNLKIGKMLKLIALYPSEGTVNDDNIDYYKGLSRHPRGIWILTNKEVGKFIFRKSGNIWRTFVKIYGKGKTKIKYRIRQSRKPKDFTESPPLILEVI